MSHTTTLLPPNSTPLERALCDITERATVLANDHAVTMPEDVTSPPVSPEKRMHPVARISTLWNPEKCPAELLPWLAWTLSVDDWDSAWSEDTKRKVIDDSIAVHRVKGTLGALRRALSNIDYIIIITESTTRAYTFSLTFAVGNDALPNSVYDEAERIALKVKNVRSYLSGIHAKLASTAQIRVLAAATDSETTIIYPEIITERTTLGKIYGAIAYHIRDTLTLYPRPRVPFLWGDSTPMLWPDATPITG